VTAVSRSATHGVRKGRETRITLLAGLGVEGDAHLGETVKHRSRVRRDPTAPNLRQVHLIPAELHDELREQGFEIAAGEMGENVTTRRVNLLGLPTRARLRLGADAVLEITGLRNPCAQLDELGPGLMRATLGRGGRRGARPEGRSHGDRRPRRPRRTGRRRSGAASAAAARDAPPGLVAAR